MFKVNRRTLTALVAVAALAGGTGTAVADTTIGGPSAGLGPLFGGQAQNQNAPGACKRWLIPAYFEITHANGWTVQSTARRGRYAWWVNAHHDRASLSMMGSMRLTRFDVSGYKPHVRFTITWKNGPAGIYTGTIDADGFLTGTARDKQNGAKTGFEFAETIECGRY
jgi:hypothetical protein